MMPRLWTITNALQGGICHDLAGEPIHPGEARRRGCMDSFGLTATALATGVGVAPGRINEIVRGCQGITAETTLRLAQYFGTDPLCWTNLQDRYAWDVHS